MKYIYKFKNFDYNLNNILLPTDISSALDKFYNDELIDIDFKTKFSILFKIKTIDGEWRNISSLQTLDKTRIDDLKEIFNIFWSYKSDLYKSLSVDKIVFRYRLLESDIAPSKPIFKYPSDFEKSGELLPQGYRNLPNNRKFEAWGDDIVINGNNSYTVRKDNHSFYIMQLDNEYFVSLKYNDTEILSFRDVYENENEFNTFIRTIGDTELYYHNGKCNFLKQSIRSTYIKTKNADTSIKDNFITMDLETRTIDNIMHVITVSIYDGSITKSFYISDFENSNELVKEAIMFTLQRKYNGYRVYIHNFSKFDAVFMLKIMAKMNNCKISRCLKRDSKIIDIKLSYNLEGKRKYNIFFRDSLLILPSSLKKLGDNFSVDVKKSIYPYKFVNDINVSLDYVGDIPSFEYFDVVNKDEDFDDEDFDGVTKDEYINYCNSIKNNIWSLKNETIKYCERDVISLYLIIKKFQIRIFRLFEADINKYPTLSSLAFAIYRINYLKNYKIPCINGELYKNLKKSYTGGSVDVYKPIGKNINRYDINSLYPYVMWKYPSPVGKITKFNGDILKYETNPFGFFYVKIKAPKSMHIPILQTKVKTVVGGVRTISPLGEWTGWYFSEEISNAKKNGYTVEIIWGYLFEKDYIFKDYVSDLYEIKKNSKKGSSDYIISKLLLNSLYGRFGMAPEKENHEIVKGQYEISKYIKLNNERKIEIKDFTRLDEEIELISFIKNNDDENTSSFDNINVAIASSITSYSRIKMGEIKTKFPDNIYYSDTDSIDMDIELPQNYISNNLGDFKFENKFKNIVYIAPKVYAAIKENNKQYVIIKGYKDKNVKFKEILKCINENEKLTLNQEKWYTDFSAGRITTKTEEYTLMATENKRKLIFENKKLIKTEPYKLIDDKLT